MQTEHPNPAAALLIITHLIRIVVPGQPMIRDHELEVGDDHPQAVEGQGRGHGGVHHGHDQRLHAGARVGRGGSGGRVQQGAHRRQGLVAWGGVWVDQEE